ncbi:hypothetical protein WJX72_011506 [[Myrmecia] bisecta]|uniref:Uncharacterized protein n=1 Tax=[Myrmecia] bisecta TaxID=41462 RepID=A0AAW1PPX4_9CHLO
MISYTAAAQMQPPTVASELIRSQQGGVVSSAEHACPSGGPVQSSTGCSPRFSALEAFTERDPNRSVSADASLVRMVIPSATPKRRHRGQGMKTHQQRAAALLSAGVSSTFAESCKTAAALDKLLRNMV